MHAVQRISRAQVGSCTLVDEGSHKGHTDCRGASAAGCKVWCQSAAVVWHGLAHGKEKPPEHVWLIVAGLCPTSPRWQLSMFWLIMASAQDMRTCRAQGAIVSI